MEKSFIEEFTGYFGLGVLLRDPVPVTGGFLHKLFRLETDRGLFALKILNPEIMCRPEAVENMTRAEAIAEGLQGAIPLVSAKRVKGSQLLSRRGQWCFVYDWVEGGSVFPPAITPEHCRKIGDILGRMHAARTPVEIPPFQYEPYVPNNWDRVDDSIIQADKEWLLALEEGIARAYPEMAGWQVVSHRDLDPKNVLWHEGKPVVIDWEAAGYIHPLVELLDVIRYWAEEDDIRTEAILSAYGLHISMRNVNWDAIFACGTEAMLGWLYWNATHLAYKENRLRYITEVTRTIGALRAYQVRQNRLKSILVQHVKENANHET